MKCAQCKVDYPSELLNPMAMQGRYTDPICGICALKQRNELHGLPEGTPFAGVVAQEMYDAAVRHRKESGVD